MIATNSPRSIVRSDAVERVHLDVAEPIDPGEIRDFDDRAAAMSVDPVQKPKARGRGVAVAGAPLRRCSPTIT